MKVMVEVSGHRGGTIMKPFQSISLRLPFIEAHARTPPLRLLGGEAVIKIPYSAFGERDSGAAAEFVLTN